MALNTVNVHQTWRRNVQPTSTAEMPRPLLPPPGCVSTTTPSATTQIASSTRSVGRRARGSSAGALQGFTTWGSCTIPSAALAAEIAVLRGLPGDPAGRSAAADGRPRPGCAGRPDPRRSRLASVGRAGESSLGGPGRRRRGRHGKLGRVRGALRRRGGHDGRHQRGVRPARRARAPLRPLHRQPRADRRVGVRGRARHPARTGPLRRPRLRPAPAARRRG